MKGLKNHKKRKRHYLKPFSHEKKTEKIIQKTNERKTSQEKKEKIKSKQVHLGWKHFREQDDTYVLVPLSKGGGSRKVDVPVTISRFELYQTCKSLFFLDGQSVFGHADDMLLDLTNFKDEKIGDTINVGGNCSVPFNNANYMEAHKIKTLRLYLRSKKISTDSDDELACSPFDTQDVMPLVGSNEESSLIGFITR